MVGLRFILWSSVLYSMPVVSAVSTSNLPPKYREFLLFLICSFRVANLQFLGELLPLKDDNLRNHSSPNRIADRSALRCTVAVNWQPSRSSLKSMSGHASSALEIPEPRP